MQVGSHIREHRARLSLSQDDLAARIYVSRQTISNWENDKTYPDVQSLLLLSAAFDATVDELIKGDVDAMNKTVNEDARKMIWLTRGVKFCVALFLFFSFWGLYQLLADWGWHMLPTGVIILLALIGWALFITGMSRIRKTNDLLTYCEVLAFTRGEPIERNLVLRRKIQKYTPRQRMLMGVGFVIAATLIGALVGFGIGWAAEKLYNLLGL